MMKWTTLKAISDIKFVQSMYIWIFLVPIAAKALENITSPALIEIFGYKFELVTQLPFSWGMFFLSAVLFAVANAIYFYHCPRIIKENTDYAHFRNQGKTRYQLTSYAIELSLDWDDIQDRLENNEYAIDSIMPVDEAQGENQHVQNIFWILLGHAERHKPKARKFSTVLYVTAGLALLYVISQNILAVSLHYISTYAQF